VAPNILIKLAKDKNAQFTNINIDRLVHVWPYLTVDSSFREDMMITHRGVDFLKQLVRHPNLRGLRIINDLPAKDFEDDKNFWACNKIGPKLLCSLLLRKSKNPIKVDFIFKNWVPPKKPKFQSKDKFFDVIKKIQGEPKTCTSVIFGEIDLSRNVSTNLFISFNEGKVISNRFYQLNFLKIMSGIVVMHSAHTISLVGLDLYDNEVAEIIDEIKRCDQSSLEHLDLSRNFIGERTVNSLSELLQLKNLSLKTLKLNNTNIHMYFETLYGALKKIIV
jgi:hypothetical protein